MFSLGYNQYHFVHSLDSNDADYLYWRHSFIDHWRSSGRAWWAAVYSTFLQLLLIRFRWFLHIQVCNFLYKIRMSLSGFSWMSRHSFCDHSYLFVRVPAWFSAYSWPHSKYFTSSSTVKWILMLKKSWLINWCK